MKEFKKVRVSKTQQGARDFLWLKNTGEGKYKLMMPSGSAFTEIKLEGTDSEIATIDDIDSIFNKDWTGGNYIMLHLFDGESPLAEAGPNYDTSNILSAYLVDENMDTLLKDGLDIPLRIEVAEGTINQDTVYLDNTDYFSQTVYDYNDRAAFINIYLNDITREPERFNIYE